MEFELTQKTQLGTKMWLPLVYAVPTVFSSISLKLLTHT